MQIDARAYVIRSNPKAVANLHCATEWNAEVSVLLREAIDHEFGMSGHVSITPPVAGEQLTCGKDLAS